MVERRIANEEDVEKFQSSQTYNDIIGFIMDLNDAAKDHDIELDPPRTPVAAKLFEILHKVNETIDLNPTQASQSRFGKPEYTGFYDSIKENTLQWMSDISTHPEVSEYFAESFGNRSRIDYGSGHELNFICCLLCLTKLGRVAKDDYQNLVLGIFPKYLRTMRKIQQTYWLEPAGSHGVWGLDDYHFLPYLFGSGQLVNDKFIRPINIHDEDIIAMYENRNLYFWCISFINRVKSASLRWHSPMLDDISGVKRWSKVNEGMIKMYKAEVLGKLPIIQHFLFGDLLPAPEGVTAAGDVGDEVHIQCWADCCGIRVPSAIAANASKTGNKQDKKQGHILRKSAAVPVD